MDDLVLTRTMLTKGEEALLRREHSRSVQVPLSMDLVPLVLVVPGQVGWIYHHLVFYEGRTCSGVPGEPDVVLD